MNYQIQDGTRDGAKEIYFDGKPDAAIRDALKELKMRWNGKKLCWYGFVSEDAIKQAINGGAAAKTDAVKTDALISYKADYMEILKRHETDWDYWESYWQKTISAAYMIGNNLIGFKKPSIKTTFCFGYGYCGLSTQEDEDRANNMAHHASTNEQYFINENLKEFDRILDGIQAVRENRAPYDPNKQYMAKCGNDIKDIGFFNYDEKIEVKFISFNNEFDGLKDCEGYLTDEELNTYEKAVKQEKAKFEKRLNTYLKRYGLSKINSWSFLSD